MKQDNTSFIFGVLTKILLNLEFWIIKNFFQLRPKLMHFGVNTPNTHITGMGLALINFQSSENSQ